MENPFEAILDRLTKIEAAIKISETSEPIEQPIGIDEAAAMTNRSRAGIYTLVSKRQIPFHKRAKHLYFFRSELNDWIRSGRQWSKKEIDQVAVNHVTK